MTEPSPIVVYLDTNDYINIHQHRQEESISSVLTYLKDQTALGHIIVAYSPMIVLEFLTRPGAGFTPNRVDRGKLLSELCGLNVFSMEFGSGNKLLRSDGNWMGPGLTKGISIKAKLVEGFAKARKEGLSTPGLNRAMKRKIASDSYIFSQLKSSSVKFGRRREDFGTMPVSQEFLDGRYFERYIKGQIREQTVQIAFTKWLTSPEEFCKIYYEYKDNPNAIDHFFGTAISSLEMAAKKGEEFSEALLKSDGARLGLRQTLIEAGVDKRDAKNLTPAINTSYEFDEQKAKMESYFGVGKAEHFVAYVSAIAKGKTSWDSSDFGDLYHFSYSYECDLFRCDKKMANIMADCASIKDKLVAKFSDLPSRIEYQISQRLAKIHSRSKSVQPTPL